MLADQAGALISRAGRLAEQAEPLVQRAGELVGRADGLLERFEPSLRGLEPVLNRLAESTSPAEVDAAIQLIDTLPELVQAMENDVLPIMKTMGTVAPDLRNLLGTSKELNEILGSLPGLGRIKKRVEERQELEDQDRLAEAIRPVPPTRCARQCADPGEAAHHDQSAGKKWIPSGARASSFSIPPRRHIASDRAFSMCTHAHMRAPPCRNPSSDIGDQGRHQDVTGAGAVAELLALPVSGYRSDLDLAGREFTTVVRDEDGPLVGH